jgi:hypothetical protein
VRKKKTGQSTPQTLLAMQKLIYLSEKKGGNLGRQGSGDRRQETGGRRQESGVRRQETGVRSQEAGDRRQEAGGRRQNILRFLQERRDGSSVVQMKRKSAGKAMAEDGEVRGRGW